MKEKEFITMLEDLIYSEQEISDDYHKAINKAIYLLNKLKTKQLSIQIVVDRSEQLVCENCKYADDCGIRIDYNNTPCGDGEWQQNCLQHADMYNKSNLKKNG